MPYKTSVYADILEVKWWNVVFVLCAVESLALSLMAGFEQCWGTVHMSVLMRWTEPKTCRLVLCVSVLSVLWRLSLFIQHDVQDMMSLSAPAVKRRLNMRAHWFQFEKTPPFLHLHKVCFVKKINCLYCVVMLTVDVCKMKHNKSY